MDDREKVLITFPEGKHIEVEKGTRIRDVLKQYDPNSYSTIIALEERTNGETFIWDHHRKVTRDIQVSDIITIDNEKVLDIYRHSGAHLLAMAVQELFPGTRIAIGPPVEDGFYYDFYREEPFRPEDLEKIEQKMKEIVDEDLPILHDEIPLEEALKYFSERGEQFKIELIRERSGDPVSVYRQGWFVDFCRGPHVPSTGYLRHFKLLSISGAYWRNDESQPQLQRIYGTVFPTAEALEEFLHFREEAKRRDHRRLGPQLDLFSIQERIGPGLVLWHPRGAIVRRELEDFLYQEHFKRGYFPVYTPHIARIEHWERSGHRAMYSDFMFKPMDMDDATYQLKPMNCPFHIAIYSSRHRSYRELPLRLFEFGTVYRYERSGVLHGLLRVRGFTQDDSHIFCMPSQIEEVILEVLEFVQDVLTTFGFDEYQIYLSTRPDKFVGSEEIWDIATNALQNALDRSGLHYEIDPGEGVFYGPKIDIKIRDALKRWWQCSTIQVDFNLPERFDLTYMADDGKYHRVVMVHRAIFGSIERFFGVLIEHFGGNFPFWLSPIQARFIPIADRHIPWMKEILQKFREKGFRVDIDERNERMSAKIRDGELEKIPFLLVAGDREIQKNTLSVRIHGHGDTGAWPLEAVFEHFEKLRTSRSRLLYSKEEVSRT